MTTISARELARVQRGRPLTDALSQLALVHAKADGAPSRGGATGRSTTTAKKAELFTVDDAAQIHIVEALIKVLDGLYVHLPQKRAMYGFDPVRQLELLAERRSALTSAEFHAQLAGIVTSVRDAHTRYVGPEVLEGQVAVLPFLVEAWGPLRDPGYLVSKTAGPNLITDDQFRPGVELLRWNGAPIDRAVQRYADQETGGRADARRARALETLTLRALRYGHPPDEEWVIVEYKPTKGAKRETRFTWRVIEPDQLGAAFRAGADQSRQLARDPAADTVRRAKKLLFNSARWTEQTSAALLSRTQGRVYALEAIREAAKEAKTGEWISGRYGDAVSAKRVRVGKGEIGYLRLWSFDVDDDTAFVNEVAALLDQLPQEGLVIDLRANPGGVIRAAERLLQLFTPKRITPTRFAWIATPLTRAMAASAINRPEFHPWQLSLRETATTGEEFSRPVPLTSDEQCNDVGQRYAGPVVAVVDANTYSSGDLFAAGFVDNGVGTLICVGEATGAGGATASSTVGPGRPRRQRIKPR